MTCCFHGLKPCRDRIYPSGFTEAISLSVFVSISVPVSLSLSWLEKSISASKWPSTSEGNTELHWFSPPLYRHTKLKEALLVAWYSLRSVLSILLDPYYMSLSLKCPYLPFLTVRKWPCFCFSKKILYTHKQSPASALPTSAFLLVLVLACFALSLLLLQTNWSFSHSRAKPTCGH